MGGCEYGDRDDPGNLQFDWLEVQLDRYRDRGMQVRFQRHSIFFLSFSFIYRIYELSVKSFRPIVSFLLSSSLTCMRA